MENIEILINKNENNSLKRSKKSLVGFLDFLLFFLIASILFALYFSFTHKSDNYNNLVEKITKVENSLADISTSSYLTEYVIDEEGNKYLKSIESFAEEYVIDQVYTSLLNDGRDVSHQIFENASIIEIDNDPCLRYIKYFRVENKLLFNNDTELSLNDYKKNLFDAVSNEVNMIYTTDEYPLLNVSVADKIYEGIINNSHQEIKEYNLTKGAYENYMEKCIKDFIGSYEPYITTQIEYDQLLDRIAHIEIIGLFISYGSSLFIVYLLIPLFIKDHCTIFMKLFRLKPLDNNKQPINIGNLIIRFVALFIIYNFVMLLISFFNHDVNTFLNVIFTDFLKFFNLFTIGTLSILLVVCNLIFTFYNKKKKQTIVEALSKIIVYEDKTLQTITIGNHEFEIKN